MAKMFPDAVATMIGILQTSFSVGLGVGPALGGLLYEVGGFQLPFSVVGCALLVGAAASAFVLPNPAKEKGSEEEEEAEEGEKKPSIFSILRIPSVSSAYYK